MSRYVAQFRTPEGRLTTVVASNETLKDLCQGYAAGCGRAPRADGELKGVTVIFPGRKPPFINPKNNAPKEEKDICKLPPGVNVSVGKATVIAA